MYIYAFLPTPDQPLDLPDGIDGSLELVSVADLSALVELELNLEMIEKNDERLVQTVLWHDRILRDVFNQTALLPLRFGTQFTHREALVNHLKLNREGYLARLNRLKNKAEYTLKLIPMELSGVQMPKDLKGKDYFLAKKQQLQNQLTQQQQQQAELTELKEKLAQTYDEWVMGEAQDGVEKIFLLVRRSEESALMDAFREWQANCLHWQLQLGEGLPPYHFV